MHHHHNGCGHEKGEGCGHHHAHGEGCGCGHEHTQDETCGCRHEHTHDESCGCGHHHAPLSAGESGLSEAQADALLAIHQRGYLPVARFALCSSRDGDAYAVVMEPVYVANAADDMDTARENGALFASLQDAGLITLDYDLRLSGYAYQEYEQSKLYAYFVETAKEAAGKPGFVLDTPLLELGSMALTDEGRAALQAMLDK